MRTAHTVRMGVWLMMGFNLLMALGSIWIFMRMAPAIEVIIDRNERSLEACEEMLASLALIGPDRAANDALKAAFITSFNRAENNITETEEPVPLKSIKAQFNKVFLGNMAVRKNMVSAITQLAKMNREAMIKADVHARQFGYAGAWAIVFMAVIVFFAGMLFKRSLANNLVKPLEEIEAVICAHQNGDIMRRCTGTKVSRDVQGVFNGLNELLDKMQFQTVSNSNFRAWF
ncbi:MAG: hypothetical protein QM498_00385 [Desulfobacterium sp.]